MSLEHEPIHPHLLSHDTYVYDNTSVKSHLEAKGGGWGSMTTGVARYDELLEPFGIPGINNWLDKRVSISPKPAILDMMGFGTMFYQLPSVDAPPFYGYSVSLNHWLLDTPDYKSPENQHIRHVTGNVLDKRTWLSLETHKAELGVQSFDLGIWYAIGGFHPEYITDSIQVYNQLLQLVYSQIHSDKGLLFTEVPWWIVQDHSQELNRWLTMLGNNKEKQDERWCSTYEINGNKLLMLLQKTKNHEKLPSLV